MATTTRTMADIARYANKTIRLSAFLEETDLPLFIDKLATQGADSPTLSIMEALDKDINVTAEYLKNMSQILQTVTPEHHAPELEMTPNDFRELFPSAYDPDTQTLSLFGMTLRKGQEYALNRHDNKNIRKTLFQSIFPDTSYDDFKNLLTALRKLDKASTPTISSPLHERISYMSTRASVEQFASLKQQTLTLLSGYQNMRKRMDLSSQQTIDDRFYGGRAMLYGVTKASTYISKEDGILQLGSRHKKHPQAIEAIKNLVKTLPFIRAVEIDHSSDIRKFRDMMLDLENMKLDCNRAFELKDRKLGQYRFSGVYATRHGDMVFERGATLPDMEIIAYDQDSPSSIAHEIAHFMDPREDELRHRFVSHFYKKVDRETLEKMGGNLDYYLSDAEIFARLGEIGFTLNQYGISPGETPKMLAERIRQNDKRQSPLAIQHRETVSLISRLHAMNTDPEQIDNLNALLETIREFTHSDTPLPSADTIERHSEGVTLDSLKKWINLGEALYQVGYQQGDDPETLRRKHKSGYPTQHLADSQDPLFTLSMPQRRDGLEKLAQMKGLPADLTNVDIDVYLEKGRDAGIFTQSQLDAHHDREFSVALTKPIEVYLGETNPFNRAIYFDMANWSAEEMALVANYTHDLYFTPDPHRREQANAIINSRSFRNTTWHEHQAQQRQRRGRPVSEDTMIGQAIGRVPPDIFADMYKIGVSERLLADGEFTQALAKHWTRIGRGGAKKLSNSVPRTIITEQFSVIADMVKAASDVMAPADFMIMQHSIAHIAKSVKGDAPEAFLQAMHQRHTLADYLCAQVKHGYAHYDIEGETDLSRSRLPGSYGFNCQAPGYEEIANNLSRAIEAAMSAPNREAMIKSDIMPETTLTGQVTLASEVLHHTTQETSRIPEVISDFLHDYMDYERQRAIQNGKVNVTEMIACTEMDSMMPAMATVSLMTTESPAIAERITEALTEWEPSPESLNRMIQAVQETLKKQRDEHPNYFTLSLPEMGSAQTKEGLIAFFQSYAYHPFINARTQSEMDYKTLREYMPVSPSLMRRESLKSDEAAIIPLSLFSHSLKTAIGEEADGIIKNVVAGIAEDTTPAVVAMVHQAVENYTMRNDSLLTGVSMTGAAIADPTSHLIERMFVETNPTDILAMQPSEALIDTTLKAGVAGLLQAAQSKSLIRGAARGIMGPSALPGKQRGEACFVQVGGNPEQLRYQNAQVMGESVKNYLELPPPETQREMLKEHYGYHAAQSLSETVSESSLHALSDALSDVSPDIATSILQTIAINANTIHGIRIKNSDSPLRKSSGVMAQYRRWEQDAIYAIELLGEHLQLPGVMRGAEISPDFLSLPEPAPGESVDLSIPPTVISLPAPEAENVSLETAVPAAPDNKKEASPPEPHIANNDDVPSAGDEPLSTRNQMRLW